MTDQETTGTGAVKDSPSMIYAKGPDGTAEQAVEVRQFDNNPAAYDAKADAALAAQVAPNPTTDVDLAREAYGDEWNRRRRPKVVGETADGDELYAHGGTVVDSAGHVVGRTTDVASAVEFKQGLGTDGEVGRYPVTAEAQAAELRERDDDGDADDDRIVNDES